MKNKTFLVTGGCGFIGSHLVNRLLNENNKVIIIDDLSIICWLFLSILTRLNFLANFLAMLLFLEEI